MGSIAPVLPGAATGHDDAVAIRCRGGGRSPRMRGTGADRLLPVIRNSGAPDGMLSAPPSAQGTPSVNQDARADQRWGASPGVACGHRSIIRICGAGRIAGYLAPLPSWSQIMA